MKFYSTNNQIKAVSGRTAITAGLAPDGGLFMPQEIPLLPSGFFESLEILSLQDIAWEVSRAYLDEDIERTALQTIIKDALDFEAPLRRLTGELFVLELFHGPTLAFKDFGARFMARTMAYFRKDESRDLIVVVATSGDTGSAVASGFYQIPGIKVVILYPSGKVSMLQEKQLTSLGENITAVKVQGSFDDCQKLAKQVFLDADLSSELHLSSANSINIARLIPQSFYYIHAFAQIRKTLGQKHPPVFFSVPSGNLGNLTAGIFAKQMGLPVSRFVAALNSNDVLLDYLQHGSFTPRRSIRTISNAMDVGNPSNLARLLELYEHKPEKMRQDIVAYSFSDQRTKAAIKDLRESAGYLLDPHGAVGYLAFQKYSNECPGQAGIVLETAHPAKFLEVMDEVLPERVAIPERLLQVINKESKAVPMPADFTELKSFLLDSFR